jgi:DNA polymerase III delta prime subunit
MTENSRLWIFFIALGMIIGGAILGYIIGGVILAISIEIIVLIAVWILHRTMLPPWISQIRVPLASLSVFAALTIAIIHPFFGIIFQEIFVESPYLNVQLLSSPTLFLHQIILISLVGLFILLFNIVWTRHHIIVEPPKIPQNVSEKNPFPRKGYAELQERFCNYMVSELDRYDNDLNWSDSEYTILQAEVEMERSIFSGMPSIVKDLVAAIRRDRKIRSFLVIGDPGAGKSVSLRRLARELYKETKFTGIVPVYINLREWNSTKEPTDEDIKNFIFKYLIQNAGREGKKFLEQWYEPMLQHGKFFFILDSFDEMPAVLDCDDKSKKLKTISVAFDRFFNDIHNCRGVLASRPFRQPQGFRGRKLTIRPFTETQIRNAMKKWLCGSAITSDESENIIKTIFTQHPQLAPALRNPFSADLIAQYIMNNDGHSPESYFAIFDNYIQKRLEEYEDEICSYGLTDVEIVECATEIAWEMYQQSEIGLEADTFQLRPLFKNPKFDNIINIMYSARLIRLGGLHNQRLSFVHRRFAEYFVVRALQKDETRLPALDSIPTDSRWRDCLSVYCGITTKEKATEIANFCWNVVHSNIEKFEQGSISETRQLIHALRFLRDSFQGNLEYLKDFQEDMAKFVKKFLKHDDILKAKLVAETVGLLKEPNRSDAIVIALEREIPWISQTTLHACRHLESLSQLPLS